MKKLVIISTLIASFAGLSAFGQGYFLFTSGKSQVYDGFSTGVSHTATDVNVAFLWAASSAVPSVDSILASVPTTATTGNSTWTAATAWTAILDDPNFTLALNSGTGNSLATVGTLATGAFSYNTGNAFPVLNTAVNGNYTVFIIAWNSLYATPAAAAAANSAVGWGSPFAYTAAALTGAPQTMIGASPNFGVGGIVPEPTTMVLAGLGGLALLAIRRRK